MRFWILVLLAAMLTELSASMSETAAAVFHTPDDIAVLLTEPAESSDDDPSESPDDACLYRIPRMLPSAALCPGSEMPPRNDPPHKRGSGIPSCRPFGHTYGTCRLPHLLCLSDLTHRLRLQPAAARPYPAEAVQASALPDPFTRKAFAVRIHTAPQPHKNHSWNSSYFI